MKKYGTTARRRDVTFLNDPEFHSVRVDNVQLTDRLYIPPVGYLLMFVIFDSKATNSVPGSISLGFSSTNDDIVSHQILENPGITVVQINRIINQKTTDHNTIFASAVDTELLKGRLNIEFIFLKR